MIRDSVRRRLGSTISASLRGRSDRLTIKTDQVKGVPALMGVDGGGPVKVHVTPKSGIEGFRAWRVVISMFGRASGRRLAREETVGVSKEEPPIESWAGRCGR